ncbi:hypothetical protein [Nocardia sp. CA-120079]|uniref:hypothetical protein n=1 Tax=Nocardia sp. CA-120079 TaxID=3239974 RepID=UPI003D98607D
MAESALDGPDWVELVEMLQFLRDWLAGAGLEVEQSLRRFVGVDGYPLEEMIADLDRFGFLLGSDNGDQLFQLNEF